MDKNQVKKILLSCIETYSKGLYSISDCIKQIDREILIATNCNPDIDTRISQQNKLYLYSLSELTKAIKAMERRI